MPVLSVSFVNYRNLQNSTINLLSKEIYFVGENGQGKTNLLESIYYSAYGNSFRTRADAEAVKEGFSGFSIKTMYRLENGTTENISVFFENGKKKIDKNGKWIKDRKELINTMPCVLFCHDDLEFAIGEPERRRFFIDQCLSMYDMLYIDTNRNYRKVLKSRNLSLKEKNYEMLEIFDAQLVQHGLEIEKKRRDAIFQFNQIFGKLYEKITGIEGVVIKYEPSWKSEDSLNIIPSAQKVFEILQSKREVDKTVMTTMSGPHRDRIRFFRNGSEFTATASTGQRRLLAILLRVGQSIFYSNVTGKKPVLLMDDVLLELDPDKRQLVTQLLPDYDQLFCTFLPGEPYERYMKKETKVFEVDKGVWNER
ncbi:MAG: DNA replication and repair protein RecF [Spirochaetia bacterium]|uniref:DNA replication/repair protein RecF n=2 Tax=Treponema TaxID=157 RepID=UPI0026F1D012|nr:DNA replication and repair protein RecF [Treponema berlinense]MDD5789433.1 DNA replication and repair protein RecF [Spirochaetia bacterium]